LGYDQNRADLKDLKCTKDKEASKYFSGTGSLVMKARAESFCRRAAR
jgi:hypothetical protein